ncbi:MAG: efflux transporter outer membrane subunit [Bacteroidales bacterium]|nr:efflux transporter outer membrane subunit [Bacteroidales bacterium]
MYLKDIIKIKKSFPCLLMLVITLTSCKVLQPNRYPDLSPDNKLFRDIEAADTTNIANVPWKSLFTDPRLQSLIEEAIKNNPDLQIAAARVKKAEAILNQSKAALYPSLGIEGDAVFKNEKTDGSGVSEAYQLYGSSSWEVDIWGKLRSTKRANLASLLESEAYRKAVQTQLISAVATNYFTLLKYDAQLQITEKTIEKREADVEAMKLMKDNDVVTGADLVLSQANRYSAEVTIPDLKQAVYETENAISLLLGRNPGPIDRGTLAEQEIAANLKTGVPAQLLANRPDVQEAEYRFRYYFEMTKVARSYFYPALTITAAGGITETDLSKLFNANKIFWNITGGLTQPVFNHRLNRQRLKIAEANQEEYLAAYKQTLLAAGEEVVNSLHAYQTATEKFTLRKMQIEYLEKSVDYTMELLKFTSNTNYTDVLTSEVNLLSAQINSVNDKLQQLQAVVSLYHSLGGGWK